MIISVPDAYEPGVSAVVFKSSRIIGGKRIQNCYICDGDELVVILEDAACSSDPSVYQGDICDEKSILRKETL